MPTGRRQAAPPAEVMPTDNDFQYDCLRGGVSLPDVYVEVGQRLKQGVIVGLHCGKANMMFVPWLFVIPSRIPEGPHYPVQIVQIFQPDMLVHNRETIG